MAVGGRGVGSVGLGRPGTVPEGLPLGWSWVRALLGGSVCRRFWVRVVGGGGARGRCRVLPFV